MKSKKIIVKNVRWMCIIKEYAITGALTLGDNLVDY